jgi:hypothetical protein
MNVHEYCHYLEVSDGRTELQMLAVEDFLHERGYYAACSYVQELREEWIVALKAVQAVAKKAGIELDLDEGVDDEDCDSLPVFFRDDDDLTSPRVNGKSGGVEMTAHKAPVTPTDDPPDTGQACSTRVQSWMGSHPPAALTSAQLRHPFPARRVGRARKPSRRFKRPGRFKD